MKINCRTQEESPQARYIRRKKEKAERLSNWHRFFAWYPVRINPHQCAWLEFVERKYKRACALQWTNSHGDRTNQWYVSKDEPEYREITKENNK